VNKKEPDKFST